MELNTVNFHRTLLDLPDLRIGATSEPTDLEPVIVTAPSQVSGTFSTAYAAFLTSVPSGPPLDDHAPPIGPDDPVGSLDPKVLVENHPEFQKLPQEMRDILLKSESATSQVAKFLSNGGTIELSNEVGMFQGMYDHENNRIVLSADTIANLISGADNRVEAMVFAVAHELGHYVTATSGTNAFDGASGEAGWVRHRAVGEALANANAMLISNEIRGADSTIIIPFTGYATNDQLVPLWNQFTVDGNFDALVEAMSDLTLQYSWNGPDLNGDGLTNREDQFIYEWRNRPSGGE